jgi:hemerythrin-like domain-containing protein
MTDQVVGPLREFRERLHEGLRTLQVAADAVGPAEPRFAVAAIDAALAYLQETLVPECRAEEITFFQAVDSSAGVIGMSLVMKAQHRSIAAMVGDFAKVVDAVHQSGEIEPYARYLVALLHGIYAAVRMHLESEDDAYLALLDEHLSESQVEMIVTNIKRITAVRPV